jgi:hypothetical protein
VTNKDGTARVAMKGDPGALTRTDPQLHYMLRLCQIETDAFKATDWIKKLSDLHNAHESERDKLEEREAESLGDLAIITSFMQDLSSAISMPSLCRKKNQMFVTRSQDLDAEMQDFKSKIDLRDFVVPLDNLLEPGVTPKALADLDRFVVENAGTKMGFLYQDLIDDCLTEIESQYQNARSQTEKKNAAHMNLNPSDSPEPPARRVELRKQKEKTRPSHSSVFEIIARPEPEQPVEEEQATRFKVRASTAEVFSTLFANAESRGSVSWAAFALAMADLGFSVQPRTGSVYTFTPPEGMHVDRSLTLHRPHKSRIERHHAIVYARRLRRVYGWDQKTFEVDG